MTATTSDTAQDTAPTSLRIVVCSDHPGVAYAMQQALPAMGHRIVAFVTSGKRRADFLGGVQVMAPHVDVLVTNSPRRLSRWLSTLEFDVLLSASFPLRLRADALALPKLGAVNMHPSLLPAYRGTMTGNWHLLNGESRIGLTMHRMTEQFDDGAILAQAVVDIGPDDDIDTTMLRLFSNGPQVAAEGLARLAAGDPGTPQDESLASYYGVIDPSLREVTWDLSARTIHNRVRAFSGEFSELGVLAEVDGQRLRVTRTRVHSEEGNALPAGSVVENTNGTLLVQCGSGTLEILASTPVVAEVPSEA